MHLLLIAHLLAQNEGAAAAPGAAATGGGVVALVAALTYGVFHFRNIEGMWKANKVGELLKTLAVPFVGLVFFFGLTTGAIGGAAESTAGAFFPWVGRTASAVFSGAGGLGGLG